MTERLEDPVVTDVRRFMDSWAEHDPDCPAATLTGPAVLDPANCTCGLTARQAEILAALAARLAHGS